LPRFAIGQIFVSFLPAREKKRKTEGWRTKAVADESPFPSLTHPARLLRLN
jgi:hypothetical protein